MIRKTATLSPISTNVTSGCSPCRLPEIVLACRTVLRPSATHCRHWKPTDAGDRHSGQAGRPHRVQDSPSAGPGASYTPRCGLRLEGLASGRRDCWPGCWPYCVPPY